MDNYLIFLMIFVASVFISSVSQVLLKKSADREHASLKDEYLNPRVIIAYALFFGSTLVTVVAYRYVPLSLGPVLEALGYVFVGILGYAVLKEKLSLKGIMGMILIIAGVFLCAL